MGTRSNIYKPNGTFRKNHNPDTAPDREVDKFRRKYGKPYRSLKAAKLWLDRALESAGLTLKEALEQRDTLPETVRAALRKWTDMNTRFWDRRNATQLRGKGKQNLASQQLEDKITERAFAMVGVTPETPAISAEKAWSAQKLIYHAKTSPAVMRDLLKEVTQ